MLAVLRSVSLAAWTRSPLAIGRKTGPSVMAAASSHAFRAATGRRSKTDQEGHGHVIAIPQALAMSNQGWLFALTGNAADAIKLLASGITAYRSTGSRVGIPQSLSYLARAYAELGQFDDAWRLIGEAATAIETSNEKWYEADIHRMAGEIAMKSPATDTVKAEAYFERALSVARQQQAKSWELRAAMSMARLWRDQGKREEARELLAPVYGWFTEGFDTLDLKEAKALLDELAS
jgi:predicted ATPase